MGITSEHQNVFLVLMVNKQSILIETFTCFFFWYYYRLVPGLSGLGALPRDLDFKLISS